MSDRTIYPGMTAWGIVPDSVAHVIAATWKYGNSYTNSKEIATVLGLDPDTVLTKDCPTCEGHGYLVDPAGNTCPCDGDCKDGTIEVNRVVAMPVEVARHLDALGDTAITIASTLDTLNDGMRALRIGRAVLACRKTWGDGFVAVDAGLGVRYASQLLDALLAVGERT